MRRTPTRPELALALLLAACGSAPPEPAPSTGEVVDLRPRWREGDRYEVVHREIRTVGEAAPSRLQTRLRLEVTEVHPDGSARLYARVFRSPEDDASDTLGDAYLRVDVGADGWVDGEPERECGTLPDLRLGRYLRHVFAARAFAARGVGQGSEWRGRYLGDLSELATPARLRVDRVTADEVEGRLLARPRVRDGEVGGARVSGPGRVRGRFSVSREDGFSGRTELALRVDGALWTARGGERDGRVEVRTLIAARPARTPPPNTRVCGFDPNVVTRAIRGRLRAIQSCYERELASDPALAGRVRVRMRVQEDGRVTDVGVEDESPPLEAPAVNACIVEIIGAMRLPTGPVGGPLRFEFPFVFAPQG